MRSRFCRGLRCFSIAALFLLYTPALRFENASTIRCSDAPSAPGKSISVTREIPFRISPMPGRTRQDQQTIFAGECLLPSLMRHRKRHEIPSYIHIQKYSASDYSYNIGVSEKPGYRGGISCHEVLFWRAARSAADLHTQQKSSTASISFCSSSPYIYVQQQRSDMRGVDMNHNRHWGIDNVEVGILAGGNSFARTDRNCSRRWR